MFLNARRAQLRSLLTGDPSSVRQDVLRPPDVGKNEGVCPIREERGTQDHHGHWRRDVLVSLRPEEPSPPIIPVLGERCQLTRYRVDVE